MCVCVLCICVCCACVCVVHVCVFIPTYEYRSKYMEVREKRRWLFLQCPIHPFFLRMRSFDFTRQARITSQWVLRSACLHLPHHLHYSYNPMLAHRLLRWILGLNAGLCSCDISTLWTESSLQPICVFILTCLLGSKKNETHISFGQMGRSFFSSLCFSTEVSALPFNIWSFIFILPAE